MTDLPPLAPLPPVRRDGPHTLLAVGLALMLLACAALAHDFAIYPAELSPRAGAVVSLDLRFGDAGRAESSVRSRDHQVRFELIGPDGAASPALGREGAAPAGLVRPDLAGPAVVVYRSSRFDVELDPAAFRAYLQESGLVAVAERRRASGADSEPGRELFSRCAKALLEVTPSAPDDTPTGAAARAALRAERFGKPVGLTLELVTEADPRLLPRDDWERLQLPVRLLFRGAPLADVFLRAHAVDQPDLSALAVTDDGGRATLRLPAAGAWVLSATHMLPAAALADGDGVRLSESVDPRAPHDWESVWTSLTLEVGTDDDGRRQASSRTTR